jgi:hypothetical protein
MDTRAIATASVPVLCIDTCSILDIMRDPTRDTVKPHDHQAAIDLVAAAEAGRLICLVAEQVAHEFASYDRPIQDEAEGNLRKLLNRIERVNRLSTVHGAPRAVEIAHLFDFVARTRAVVGRLLAVLDKLPTEPLVTVRAFARVNACIAPAKRGKDSTKDCLICETYLEAATALRRDGVTAPIVFLSSNTKDYTTESGDLVPDLDAEFGRLGLTYARSMSQAKFVLGFTGTAK